MYPPINNLEPKIASLMMHLRLDTMLRRLISKEYATDAFELFLQNFSKNTMVQCGV
jgi:hypothetical protein